MVGGLHPIFAHSAAVLRLLILCGYYYASIYGHQLQASMHAIYNIMSVFVCVFMVHACAALVISYPPPPFPDCIINYSSQ